MEEQQEIKNLNELVIASAKKYDEKILYRCENITYKNFCSKVQALKNALINMNLKNKKVAIISENRYEWEIAFLATISAQNIVVPIDKTLPKNEIETIINRTKVEAIFYSKDYESELNELKNKYDFLHHLFSFDSANEESFNSLIDIGKNLNIEESSINENDVCCIIFTSGTTSQSKAVMLTHKNICSNLINTSKIMGLTEKDIALSVLPLNHVLEGLYCFLLSIYNGLERIYCHEIDEIIEYIKKYKITFMGGVPLIYNYLYEKKEELEKEAEHINLFMSGGAKLNPEIVEKYKEIGINIVQGYGLTECSPVVSMETKNENKLGSVGKAIPNVQIKLENEEDDGIDEILVKGDNIFKGYFDNEKDTRESIVDGWFHTGDLGKIDKEGYLYICGRNKEMIVLQNGKKVFPQEIESILNKNENIIESFIFDNSSKIYAEIVYNKESFTNKNEDEIKNILMKEINTINQNLPKYKNISNIYVTDEPIERTWSGKIKRNKEKEKLLSKDIDENVIIDENDNFGRVKKIIESQLGKTKIEVDSNLTVDLGADSLDIVELFIKIEKEFNVTISKEERRGIATVGDILKLIK